MRKQLNNQMVAVLLQAIPSFYTTFSKNSLFLFLQTFIKNTMWVKNAVLPATMTGYASYPYADIILY